MTKQTGLFIASCGILIAAFWFTPRPSTFVPTVRPAALYPIVADGARPTVLWASELPRLAGYDSPKPVVAADDQGNVVVVAHGIVHQPLGIDILAWRSVDRGQSWGPPQNLTNVSTTGAINFDPWLETDRRGQYYIVYALRADGRPRFRRSNNAAQSWSDPVPITDTTCDRPVLGISPNGKLLVVASALHERSPNAPQVLQGNDPDLAAKVRAAVRFSAGIFISRDYGDSWEKWESPFRDNEHAIPFSVVVDDSERVAASWIVEGNGSRSALSVSKDRGRTWEITTLVESLQPDRPHPFNGERFPGLARDEAGLHVAYVTAGATALMVRASRDWSFWKNPLALSNSAADEVRLSAIDACGPMVHVTWLERTGMSWHAFYRGSHDRGATWSKALCLSESIQTTDSIASGFKIYGDDDQSSIRDDGLGRTHAVWCVAGGRVWHAVIEWSGDSD